MDERTINELLEKLAAGDERARDQLLHLLYQELRGVARRLMANQKLDHTLEATALVHEAFCKIFCKGKAPKEWKDKKHFLRYLAQAMGTILVDWARRKSLGPRVPLDGVVDDLARQGMHPTDFALCLQKLEETDPELAELVELRVFGGYTLDQCAEILGISKSTLGRRWQIALAWLRRELADD